MKNFKVKMFNKLGIAIVITLFFKIIFFRLEDFLDIDLLFMSGIVLIIWQGNETIDKWLNRRYKWIDNAKKRLIIQSFIAFIFTAISLFILMYILHQIKFDDGRIINRKMVQIFPSAILFTFSLLAVKIGSEFFIALKNSLLEIEKHKTESTNAQLKNLKNQLNPHFLFNNLSVLTSLVHKNQDKAVDFIHELAKVYRYILDTKNSELVTLKDELDFINHYIYLQKIRFDESIIFEININESNKSDFILPMCLQMLVENTIQHNEASQANPLKVVISTTNDSLIIENPIKLRSNVVDSTQTGLKNIELRYSFYTDQKVIVINDGVNFKVILPLINKK